MESINNNESQDMKKLSYNTNDFNIRNEYCPHIFDHFLNPYLNSKCEKIIFDIDNQKNNSILYSRNLSVIQNPLKSFNYYGYTQSKNLLDSYLINNLSLDKILINNPQNLSFGSINREGCIFSLSLNDTGNLLASSNQKNLVEIWDLENKKLKKIIDAHSEIITDVEFFHKDQENNTFLSSSIDKTIKLWKNYKTAHTFIEHNDWVTRIAVREDNKQFISGCVSSVVKIWDILTQRVVGSIINNKNDHKILSTVNSINYFRTNPSIFAISFRSGEVSLYDLRVQNKARNEKSILKNVGLIQSFKAYDKKLNLARLNHNDTYILTSNRSSSIRLWDIRNIKNIQNDENFVSEYNKHRCIGYNIECNFYINEKYIITGSENSHIYIYDVNNSNNYKEIPTQQKCINLIKPIPNSYDFVYSALEDICIFIWSSKKNILKCYEKLYSEKNKDQKKDDYIFSLNEQDKEIKDFEETERSKSLCNKLIEEIMSDYGDMILRIFHNNNLTYSNLINFDSLIEIIQKRGDGESKKLLELINEKFLEKLKDNFISGFNKSKKKDKNEITNEKTKADEKKTVGKKREIKCINCLSDIEKNKLNGSNNIYNSVDENILNQLLMLPNDYQFLSEKENEAKNSMNEKNETSGNQININDSQEKITRNKLYDKENEEEKEEKLEVIVNIEEDKEIKNNSIYNKLI